MNAEGYDVVITDLQMPGMTGLEFIRQLENRSHGAQVLMVTAHATVSSAVEAMRHGAFDYIEKPFDADRLEQLVARALERGRMLDQRAPLRTTGQQSLAMIGNSPAMLMLRARIAQVGPTRETVLITGESGTGKELVARQLHEASSRSNSPLVSLNCPALSSHLMESELFGHERGAFTGAEARGPAVSNSRRAARSCSTKSPRSSCRSRPSCSACCRNARWSASAPARPFRSTCA